MQTSLNSAALESIVAKPTWKEILLELTLSKQIDPWNIDIAEICDGFVKKVRDMESLDLLIPANVILAAAILLRYKSDWLRFEDATQGPAMDEAPQFDPEEIPQLSLASRIPPKRQITLSELVGEMERIIKYENNDRMIKKKTELEIVNLHLQGVDIEKMMEETLGLIKQNIDNENWALFSTMVKGKKRNEVIFYLLSVLHLTQKNLVGIRQDTLWGDIFIRVLDAKTN